MRWKDIVSAMIGCHGDSHYDVYVGCHNDRESAQKVDHVWKSWLSHYF